MPYISIIVPAYNPGEHFGNCLRSIAAQTFRDYEVIVIDDGSSTPIDPVFVSGFDFPRDSAKVVRTDNHGPYAARRKGIAEAYGDYFMNVDADDELIGIDALAKIAAALDAAHVDMLLVNASSCEDGSAPFVDYSELTPGGRSQKVATIETSAFKNLFAKDYIYNSAWTKVVRRECIDGLSEPFPRVIMAEDRMLDMDFLPSVRSSAILDEPLYYYRPYEASITHSNYRLEYYLQVCTVETRVLDWLDAVGFDEESWAENFLCVTCNALLGLFYNTSLLPRELDDAFDAIRVQEVYGRAASTRAETHLGIYNKMLLRLLDGRSYTLLRALMRARRLGSRVRSAIRGCRNGDDI